MSRRILILVLMVLFSCAVITQAAFIVEPNPDGLGSANFTGTPRWSETESQARGLQSDWSAFGSTVADPFDVYTFSYTPGTDVDNWVVPPLERYFGNGLYSTNLAGGPTGYYNVYVTWPGTSGMTTTCDIAIAHDGGVVLQEDLDMNSGGTIALASTWGPFPPGTVLLGANNKWLKVADNVHLTTGQTYLVTQTSSDGSWTSMRSGGVMWEFVEVPEPVSVCLLVLGSVLIRRRS